MVELRDQPEALAGVEHEHWMVDLIADLLDQGGNLSQGAGRRPAAAAVRV